MDTQGTQGGTVSMTNYIGRHDLTDEEYQMIAAFLPAEYSGKAGHPYVRRRKVLNGLLWRLRTGAPWRDIPECYGPWSTIQTRFRRWQQEGLWQKILNALQGRARKLGRINFGFSAFDGSSVRAHKCAAGAEKKGARPEAQPRREPGKTGPGRKPGRPGDQDPRSVRG